MKKKNSKAKIILSFRSFHLDLDFISDILHLIPSKVEKIGDKIESLGIAKTSSWKYEFIECNVYEEMDENISKILNFLLTKDYIKINENSEIHEKVLSVVVWKSKNDLFGIDLSSEEIGKLKILGLHFAISVYDN
jgi:hypothetical protein